jgi:hypothetical protein
MYQRFSPNMCHRFSPKMHHLAPGDETHVKASGDQAKCWLYPIALASNYGFRAHELAESRRTIDQHQQELMEAWNEYFKSKPEIRRAYVPTTALARSVEFDDDMMHVFLRDGRIISVPIIWFPVLYEATPQQRSSYEIGGGGISLHWPEIDEDLSVANLLAGADWQST